ncbi:hypothetical protein [Draconibacterium orientale]|uniref:hypothetical protein n=1 Tax=Draconibacterium orientale TaxID=1168034 RepID=UPI002A0A4157|nr:hypothetical protein [Draconibacterium orientale]
MQQSSQYPSIYPDYIDVTISENISPLNFLLRDSVEKTVVIFGGKETKITIYGEHKIQFPELSKGKVPFDTIHIEKIYKDTLKEQVLQARLANKLA